MTKLFDMITSTSTGGLLAASLVVPDPANEGENMYYSDAVVTIYEYYGPQVYQERSFSKGWLAFIIIASVILSFALGYLLGCRIFANPKVEHT